ncbi:Sel1 repeat-containing protein [Shimia sagamensis]|uniref:Sel1 repeat-containing protein n=2 Tax=Shimia sagamensis TaxID=1566352 RepID=A0ABY1PIW2_9RHOB|nr:Sel1 repeat-containing protein [Shimia sagamensis]
MPMGGIPAIRQRMALLALATYLSAVATGGVAQSEPARLAVVIGNQDYAGIDDLANAKRDAERFSAMLRDLGFTVFDGYNLDRQGFEDLLRASILNVTEGAEIVFFYAGHGIQIGRRNYLLPTDVAFESVYDLPVESVTLDRVIEVLSARGKVHVAIIDACRDNPFPDKVLAGNLDASLFETKSGFDVFQTPLNSLVAFSTAPGMVAFDGNGNENSPYTAAIVNAVSAEPERDILSVFAQVRKAVYNATDGKQVPWESSTLVQPFHFGRTIEAPVVMSSEVVVPVPDSGGSTRQVAAQDFPSEVTLPVSYDRQIDLGPALAVALGQSALPSISITTVPNDGLVSVRADGLMYRPVLSERRATERSASLRDQFSVTVQTNGAEVPITVLLEMEVNACDLAAGDALDPGSVGFYRLPNEIEVDYALEVCQAAVEADPDEGRFSYQLGRAQQAAGQLHKSFLSFQTAVTQGHIRALNGTGRFLISKRIDHQATGIPQNAAGALALYEKGIEAGDPFAMHSKGLHFLRNGQDSIEREMGFELMDRAAELGHTYSMNELGIYFLKKDTDHFLPERGLRYLQASAARQDIYGYYNLGYVEANGLNGDKNLDAAYRWYLKASDGGHPFGPSTLARMIRRGDVPGQGNADALVWYDEGLSRGDGWGGVNAARMVLKGEGAPADVPAALIRLAKARHLSNEKAAAAALEGLQGHSAQDLAKATQLLLRDMGADVAVDGAIGPATRRVLATMAAEANLQSPANSRLSELETVARIYWAKSPTRPDLF